MRRGARAASCASAACARSSGIATSSDTSATSGGVCCTAGTTGSVGTRCCAWHRDVAAAWITSQHAHALLEVVLVDARLGTRVAWVRARLPLAVVVGIKVLVHPAAPVVLVLVQASEGCKSKQLAVPLACGCLTSFSHAATAAFLSPILAMQSRLTSVAIENCVTLV